MSEAQNETQPRKSQPKLHYEMEAVRLLFQQMKAIGDLDDSEDDDSLAADMVEGETSLYDAIDLVLNQINENSTMVEALKIQEQRVQDRRKRIEAQIERQKFVVANALTLARKDTHKHPLCTISRKKQAPQLEIVEEWRIPGEYWEMPEVEPKLNKRRLLADLKAARLANVELPGVTLTDESYTHAWKWK